MLSCDHQGKKMAAALCRCIKAVPVVLGLTAILADFFGLFCVLNFLYSVHSYKYKMKAKIVHYLHNKIIK